MFPTVDMFESSYWDYIYARGDFSGFVTNPEHFGTGIVLPFTRRWLNRNQKCPSLVASPRDFESKI